MDKRLLKLVLCFLLIANVSLGAVDVKYGPTIGLNIADLKTNDQYLDYDQRLGLHLGLLVEVPVLTNFSIMPGVIYSMKGANIVGNGETLTTSYNYFEVPVMATYRLKSGINFSAGPYVGLLSSASVKGQGVDIDLIDGDYTNMVDYGAKFGLGFSLDEGLGLGVSYGLGIADIYKYEGSDDYYIKNAVIGISISYMFDGK